MGPYCNYCGERCFTFNPFARSEIVPGPILLATCRLGCEHDYETLGYSFDFPYLQSPLPLEHADSSG